MSKLRARSIASGGVIDERSDATQGRKDRLVVDEEALQPQDPKPSARRPVEKVLHGFRGHEDFATSHFDVVRTLRSEIVKDSAHGNMIIRSGTPSQ